MKCKDCRYYNNLSLPSDGADWDKKFECKNPYGDRLLYDNQAFVDDFGRLRPKVTWCGYYNKMPLIKLPKVTQEDLEKIFYEI